MPNSRFLVADAVTKRFDGTLALDDAGISVAEGESLALLGPSGCGKTTLLRVIAGLENPDHGTVSVGREVLTGFCHHVPAERRRVGMVFQDAALFPHLSVARNVAYGLSRAEVAAGRVQETLEMVDLAHLADRRPH
jgi:iron(III) transport system ATP-binding protein